MRLRYALFLSSMLAGGAGAEGIAQRPEVVAFIQDMKVRHRFDPAMLERLFAGVEIQEGILAAMARPAEAKPWYQYRKLFVTEARILGGVEFWRQHAETLSQVQRRYGVPAETIVAIVGVETLYGRNTGGFRVIDALATLAFAYPRRADFFRSELEQFLLLCREEGLDAAALKGSYAGAMGWPQFMPSSFRNYATDLDGDGRRDIWSNPADAIGSIGNYFARFGWRTGEEVAVRATAREGDYAPYLGKDLKPASTLAELRRLGIEPELPLPDASPVKLLRFELEAGPEYWLGLENFFVISRYNHSALYSMAVYQLGRAIATRKGG
ncbi:lytic murein transglycosylase B [Methylococcus sp. Mc7]|uniref:lytic murein transglycosylase B n=1 Tax=Methylococcus sp. Mc7 TaxID=2860258 RepID=UPI001C532DB6|nr:lytic murein transglycosylase B [Methylococcus sp. Mc7]QXP85243.1 lytic murein transglycosylase B [Methylococcus sp. Mc7]